VKHHVTYRASTLLTCLSEAEDKTSGHEHWVPVEYFASLGLITPIISQSTPIPKEEEEEEQQSEEVIPLTSIS